MATLFGKKNSFINSSSVVYIFYATLHDYGDEKSCRNTSKVEGFPSLARLNTIVYEDIHIRILPAKEIAFRCFGLTSHNPGYPGSIVGSETAF